MKKHFVIVLVALLGLLGVFWWLQFALPRYQYIDLSINQVQAVELAQSFLKNRGFDLSDYKHAAIFDVDDDADRYLQKTIGIAHSQKLISDLDYDIFGWSIRFFKEKQKEEFLVYVSSKTGNIVGFNHAIDETASKPFMEKDVAKEYAIEFLRQQFGFNPNDYLLHSDNSKKQLNRTDYRFTWESKRIRIPWDNQLGGGSAKLITMVNVSGGEVLSYTKAHFDIPDGFNRYVDNLKQTGQNLTLVFRIFYLCLLTMAIMLVVNRKNHFVPRIVKSTYFKLGIFLYLLLFLEAVNSYQYLLYSYPTTQSYYDYMIRRFIENLVNPFFLVLAFILPALAGESLRFEVDEKRKEGGLFSSILSSFMTKKTAYSIFIGYAVGAFVLGVQAFIFDFGYRYFGVWEELSWLTKASSSAFPAITAMLIGVHASFSEETMFRLFGINLLKRYGLGIGAVFLSALMWGIGHAGYAIYPMWFRGFEVTCLGIILGFVYLRFGLIAVITAHYLMDVFLSSMPHLLVPKFGIDFYSAIFILAVPMLIAFIASILNQSSQEREWKINFNAQQQFNYQLLLELAQSKSEKEQHVLAKDLMMHGWDPAVVKKVFEEKGK